MTILFNVSYGIKSTTQRKNKGNNPATTMKIIKQQIYGHK